MDSAENEDGGAPARSVFVSYSRADQKRAMPVIQLLEDAGYKVWWDGLLEGGANYLPTTEAALTGADAVVVLWSKTSVDSHWVRDEAMNGRERRCLVPLSIDGSEAPLGFRQFQVLDVSKWRGRPDAPEAQRILRAVAAQTGAHEGAPAAAKPSAGFRPSRRALIGGAVAAGGVGAAGLWIWRGRDAGPAGNGSSASVAVIPFENLSGDPGQAYLSDGISEEIRTVLAQNQLLKVVAQSSASTFREGQFTVAEMAKQLGVAFILTGSVRRSGDTLRITARLTDGSSGVDSWTETFDRPAADVFAVESEIANRVADALTATLGASANQAHDLNRSVRKGGTKNVAALDAYLKGQSLFYFGLDENDEREGLAKYDEAIALDPRYAAAYAARARAIPYIADRYGRPEDLPKSSQAALDAARQAVRLAPDMAEGHSALGYVLFTNFLDAKAARAPFERSMELAPGEEAINSWYARFAGLTGRDAEAVKSAALALSLSPLDASVQRGVGRVHFWARRYDQAIAALQRALEMSPGISGAHTMIGTALQLLGRSKEALDYHLKEPPSSMRLVGLAIAQQALGQVDAARKSLADMITEHGDHALYQQAQVHAQWGDTEKAFECLGKAYTLRDTGLVFLLTDPMLDPLRKDPRISQLLLRIGFA